MNIVACCCCHRVVFNCLVVCQFPACQPCHLKVACLQFASWLWPRTHKDIHRNRKSRNHKSLFVCPLAAFQYPNWICWGGGCQALLYLSLWQLQYANFMGKHRSNSNSNGKERFGHLSNCWIFIYSSGHYFMFQPFSCLWQNMAGRKQIHS